MKLTKNEENVLMALKEIKIGFMSAEHSIDLVFPSTEEEVRHTVYNLMQKGAPIRDVGLARGGWRLVTPRTMIKHHLDLIERSQKEIYNIMQFSNQKYYEFLEK